eukprot:gb/GECH01000664.1/.p1 GENE.gb/GECH01000664.1/~~gb/GECH01000664.1/.p1  ORF type:complete len:248 (+),score=23.86 gb/GECH01000664.1/:1-744(+)
MYFGHFSLAYFICSFTTQIPLHVALASTQAVDLLMSIYFVLSIEPVGFMKRLAWSHTYFPGAILASIFAILMYFIFSDRRTRFSTKGTILVTLLAVGHLLQDSFVHPPGITDLVADRFLTYFPPSIAAFNRYIGYDFNHRVDKVTLYLLECGMTWLSMLLYITVRLPQVQRGKTTRFLLSLILMASFGGLLHFLYIFPPQLGVATGANGSGPSNELVVLFICLMVLSQSGPGAFGVEDSLANKTKRE